jgi:hypothetical protein
MSRREIKGLAISVSVYMDRARSKHIPGLCISCFGLFRPQHNPEKPQLDLPHRRFKATRQIRRPSLDDAIQKTPTRAAV